jgi:hypothetical protein
VKRRCSLDVPRYKRTQSLPFNLLESSRVASVIGHGDQSTLSSRLRLHARASLDGDQGGTSTRSSGRRPTRRRPPSWMSLTATASGSRMLESLFACSGSPTLEARSESRISAADVLASWRLAHAGPSDVRRGGRSIAASGERWVGVGEGVDDAAAVADGGSSSAADRGPSIWSRVPRVRRRSRSDVLWCGKPDVRSSPVLTGSAWWRIGGIPQKTPARVRHAQTARPVGKRPSRHGLARVSPLRKWRRWESNPWGHPGGTRITNRRRLPQAPAAEMA